MITFGDHSIPYIGQKTTQRINKQPKRRSQVTGHVKQLHWTFLCKTSVHISLHEVQNFHYNHQSSCSSPDSASACSFVPPAPSCWFIQQRVNFISVFRSAIPPSSKNKTQHNAGMCCRELVRLRWDSPPTTTTTPHHYQHHHLLELRSYAAPFKRLPLCKSVDWSGTSILNGSFRNLFMAASQMNFDYESPQRKKEVSSDWPSELFGI